MAHRSGASCDGGTSPVVSNAIGIIGDDVSVSHMMEKSFSVAAHVRNRTERRGQIAQDIFDVPCIQYDWTRCNSPGASGGIAKGSGCLSSLHVPSHTAMHFAISLADALYCWPIRDLSTDAPVTRNCTFKDEDPDVSSS